MHRQQHHFTRERSVYHSDKVHAQHYKNSGQYNIDIQGVAYNVGQIFIFIFLLQNTQLNILPPVNLKTYAILNFISYSFLCF